jgi:hypothetical protein
MMEVRVVSGDYGDNYDRLVAIKKKAIRPTSSVNQNIRPV